MFEQIGKALGDIVSITPGGLPSLLVIVGVLIALIVVTRLGLGPVALRDKLTDRRRDARSMTAEEYRAEAERLAEKGDYKEAVRARFRAIIRELEQRAVLDPRPGRTAGEIAREGGAVVPSIRGDLRTVADTFNLVWYGRHTATRAEYDTVRAADERIRSARLAPVTVDA